MILKELKLTNFRNYGNQSVTWDAGINMIVGDNAQGKTNLLEAIALLSTFHSFRKSSLSELIYKNRDFFLLRSCFSAGLAEHTMNAAYSKEKKYLVRLDGEDKKRVAPLVGLLNTVVFSPDDLMLMKGKPEDRRNFLDREIIQISPGMQTVFNRYHKALKQRNALLKSVSEGFLNQNLLDAYDEPLAENGAYILWRRKDMLERLQPLVRLSHRKITDGNEELLLNYECSLDNDLRSNQPLEIWKNFFSEALRENREKDIKRGITTLGPHRDDIRFYLNGDDIRIFGSQGQQRTAALALKIGELELMKGQKGEYPVFLLDDVLSELDEKRKSALIEVINGKLQTFITDTGNNKLFKNVAEYSVNSGFIKPIN